METPAETAERLLHASSFGAVAAAYAKHRPGYSDDAIRWCLEPVVSGAEAPRVVDLGAGTGILTAALSRLGAEVTAVEPDPEMLAELRHRMPGVRSVPGHAEKLPVPDGSLDAVLAGQSMHWFDMDRAIPEIARVLVPGGVFAALWNVDDDQVGWVAELVEKYQREASNTVLRWRNGNARAHAENLARAGTGLFEPGETAEFPNGQVYTADSLAATVATHSHLLVMNTSERASQLARISDFLHTHPETSRGEFTLPMMTVVLRARRDQGATGSPRSQAAPRS